MIITDEKGTNYNEDTMINTPREIINSVNSIEEEVDKLNDKTNKIEDLITDKTVLQ